MVTSLLADGDCHLPPCPQPSVCPHRGSAIPVSGVRLTDLYTGCLHVYSFSLRFIEVV